MSGARRKSKNPQKWEECVDQDDQLPNSFESAEVELNEPDKSNQGYVYDEDYLASTSMTVPLSTKVLDEKSTGEQNLISGKKYFEGSSDEEDDFDMKESEATEGEMTILDVLQGSRQGLIAECKACSIHLKDWSSTVSHIQSHRLVFIPFCVKDDGNSSIKQPATCLLCQKVCQSLSVLVFHAHTQHSLTKTPFVCPFCGRIFSTSSLLQKHIDIRDVCMKCPVCSATYDQEYELYAHLSDCLPTFHPHLKSLTCHVCEQRISMNSLANHMISHSAQGHDVKQTKCRIKLDASPRRNKVASPNYDTDSSVFLCEICDGRFICFDNFRRHLFDHTQTKMYCPLCYLKGFERVEWVVRHLMLRCPRRSREQFEFGCVISFIGKEKRLNFLQVIKDIHHLYPFREGLLTWASIPLVQELLTNVESLLKKYNNASNGPTDIDFLVSLSEFEREMQKHRTHSWTPHCANEFLEHRPPAQEIRKNCPGVTLLHDVDVKRLKPLYDEAIGSMERDTLAAVIENGTFTANDFLRLEWEAQYLREKEPFYFPLGKERKMFSPLRMVYGPSPETSMNIDPETMQRIHKDLKKSRKEDIVVSQEPLIKRMKLNSLLEEAKEC